LAANLQDPKVREQAYAHIARTAAERADTDAAQKALKSITDATVKASIEKEVSSISSTSAPKPNPQQEMQECIRQGEEHLRAGRYAEAQAAAIEARDLATKARGGGRRYPIYVPVEAIASLLAATGLENESVEFVNSINTSVGKEHTYAEVLALIRSGKHQQAVAIVTETEDLGVASHISAYVALLAAYGCKDEVETLVATGHRSFDRALLYLAAARGVIESLNWE
jgi:hypothetical protein